MRKPEWADVFMEEDFDYGFMKAYMAKVGDFSQAIRHPTRVLVKEAVYGEEVVEVTRDVYCDECDHSHEEKFWERELIKPAKYKNVPLPSEEEVHTILRDWFVGNVKRCEDYLKLAKERGLSGE
jgi:hypothetical protein